MGDFAFGWFCYYASLRGDLCSIGISLFSYVIDHSSLEYEMGSLFRYGPSDVKRSVVARSKPVRDPKLTITS